MKLIKKLLLTVFLLVSIFIYRRLDLVSAQACDNITDVNQRISCLGNELDRLGAQSRTLSNQIAQFNAQIKLASLNIDKTEEKIALLGGRIDQLEISLDDLTKAFSSRAVETYRLARSGNTLFLLLSSNNLNEAISRFHYLQVVQKEDGDFLQRLQTAQVTYKNQKTDQEELQAELQKQKTNLDVQKKAKNSLLLQTKNDEIKYQDLLSQAFAEKAAIERALVSGVKVGPVNQGDPIGLVGNSGYPGCSTGKHLHFEVRRSGQWVDPGGYLQNKSVINEQNGFNFIRCHKGAFIW